MSEFFSSNTHAGDHLASAQTWLSQLRSVPALADRYAGIDTLDSLDDLIKVPLMVKNDLNVALEHLQPRAEGATTWVFQSGGSTGSPKLGYAPTGLYMDEVYAQWKPLGRDDIFVNGWSAGRLWGAHYLVAALVDLSHCTAIPLGSVSKTEYDAWLQFFAARRVTAYGGTPSVLRLVFAHAREAGVQLPDLRSVLFLGEAWGDQLDEDLPAVAPNARRWGMYGSTETWVVATNTPDCGADMWHTVPSQLVHVGEGDMLDFTTLNPNSLNPVLRYQTGDAGRFVTCTCGSETPALQLHGRRDGIVKFRGYLVNADDIVSELTARPGVSRAQLVITESARRAAVLEVLVLATRDADAELAEQLRQHILGSGFGPSTPLNLDPSAFQVRIVDSLITNDRTGKTSNLVVQQDS